MKNLFKKIKKNKLSVREIERIVKNKKVIQKSKIDKNKNLIHIENKLIPYLATKVVISKSKNKGILNIHFSNTEDLERIIDLIINEN